MEPAHNSYTTRPFPVDLNTLLELYFDPSLTPAVIARQLNLSLRDLIDATLHPDFEAAVAALRALHQRRAAHLADVAAHSTLYAIADGVKAVQANLAAQKASDNQQTESQPGTTPSNEAPESARPDAAPLAASPSRARAQSATFCPRRALDSLVRTLDRLQKLKALSPGSRTSPALLELSPAHAA